MEQKKSQVTIFLILGIVMVITFATLILINKYFAKSNFRQEISYAREIVFDVQPIENFVEECFFLVSKNGLNQTFDEFSIREQLVNYVENNIDACLDFSAFEKQGFDISREDAAIEVSINQNDIVFKMEYPIIITGPSGDKTEIKDFLVKHKTLLEEA